MTDFQSPSDPAETLRPESKPANAWKRLPVWARVAVPAAGVLVVAGVAVGIVAGMQPSKLEAALTSCGLETKASAQLGDEGHTLTLDMVGEDDFGKLAYDDVFCVLDAIEIPDSVTAQMGETRSLDGRQNAQWDDIEASWGYHPDSGLDLILTVR
jgi:hypothetical protein